MDTKYTSDKYFLKFWGEFPGSPVVTTLHSHCWGPEFNPWSTQALTSESAESVHQDTLGYTF